ncbi:MAG: ATP-binding protein [Litorimonas sp.]
MTSQPDRESVDRRVGVRRKEDYFWLKRLSDISGDACVVVSRDLELTYTDPKLAELLRIEPSVFARLETFSDLSRMMAEKGYFGPGEPRMFEALMSDLLVNQRLKQSRTTELINAFTPCGRHIDIRVSLGRDDSYIVLVRDNTGSELKKRALDTALKVGESGYWFYNLFSGEFTLRADSLRKHFKPATFDRIIKSGFLQVVHPDDREKTNTAIEQAVSTCQSTGITIRIVGDDKAVIHVSAHVMPNVDENGKVRSLACFFTNVTKEIRAKNESRALREKAEAALAIKNEFLGRLSHEVRTPMNAVVGLADAVLFQNNDPALTPNLELIQSSAEKIIRLVDETLDHSKLESKSVVLERVPTSPADLVRDACRIWNHRALTDGTKLVCKIKSDVPETLPLDAHRLEQCLNNLISNALKFSIGGTVQVVLTTNGTGAARKLVLAVRDTGIGMTEAETAQIFLPFQQADTSITRRFGGTGLGLTITKDLIELMDGKISVTSEPGEGSMFVVTLPCPETKPLSESAPVQRTVFAEAADTPEAKTKPEIDVSQDDEDDGATSLVDALLGSAEQTRLDYSRLRVLIVDDNATNHIVVSSLLSTIVGEIGTAHNGEEAIEALKEKTYDIVLMDIHMPVMDGIEATLAIRSSDEAYAQVPIIALTADPQYQQSRLCRNIGMNESLAKPIRLTHLLQAFDDILTAPEAEPLAA